MSAMTRISAWIVAAALLPACDPIHLTNDTIIEAVKKCENAGFHPRVVHSKISPDMIHAVVCYPDVPECKQ